MNEQLWTKAIVMGSSAIGAGLAMIAGIGPGIGEGYAVIQNRKFEKTRLEVDDVVSCFVRPNSKLTEELRAAGIKAVGAGDAVKVKNLHHAVMDGATFGKNVDKDVPFNPNNAPMSNLPLEIQKQLFGN